MHDMVFLVLLFIIIIAVILSCIRSSDSGDLAREKGRSGELFVTRMIKQNLDANKYHLITDVTLPINNSTTQIDHIVVSQFGVFVIETKNIKGWIYGSGSQKQWTQNVFGYRYKLQNPLHQNYKHIKALQGCLGMSRYYLFPVVVFVGDSVFKSAMPANITHKTGLIRFIQSTTNSIISPKRVSAIINHINSNRLEPTADTDRTHVENVRKSHSANKQNHYPFVSRKFRKNMRMIRRLSKLR